MNTQGMFGGTLAGAKVAGVPGAILGAVLGARTGSEQESTPANAYALGDGMVNLEMDDNDKNNLIFGLNRGYGSY